MSSRLLTFIRRSNAAGNTQQHHQQQHLKSLVNTNKLVNSRLSLSSSSVVSPHHRRFFSSDSSPSSVAGKAKNIVSSLLHGQDPGPADYAKRDSENHTKLVERGKFVHEMQSTYCRTPPSLTTQTQ